MTSALFLLGLGLAVAGLAVISPPAALIAAGTGISALAIIYERGARR